MQKLPFLLAALLISPVSYADTKAIMTFTGGAAFVSAPDNNDLTIGLSQYDYDADNDGSTPGVFGGFVGAEFLINPDWAIQAGVSYYQSTSFTASGTVTQGIDPQSSSSFNYEYDIITRQVLAEAKILMNWKEKFHPYLSLGLGAGFNQSFDYDVNIVPCGSTFSPEYEDETISSFSYLVGLGFDYDLKDYLRLGLGYRFTNFGKASLGDGFINNTTVEQSLEQSSLNASELIFQISFVM
jgi:outer membrane autotransporter protein